MSEKSLRAKAEMELLQKPWMGSMDRPAREVLHELHVHQIELEMQNEELRRAHTALEEVHDRYVQLYDFAPVGYLTLTLDGLIKEANLTCAALLGVDRRKLINRHFAHFVAPEYGDLWHRHFLHAKLHEEKQSYELVMRRADGVLFQAQIDCLQLATADLPPTLHITVTDVTKYKLAEEALRIADIAVEADVGIIVADAEKVILRVNDAFSDIFGYSTKEAIGQPLSFLNAGLPDAEFNAMWASTGDETCCQGEVLIKRKDGEVFPLGITIAALSNDAGDISKYVLSVRDLTRQKRLEDQVTTSEYEMKKIKHESGDINTAFNVLLKHQGTAESDAHEALALEIEGTVMPFVNKLRSGNSDRNQGLLIDIIETNLQLLLKHYGDAQSSTASSVYRKLTPVEVQVASLIRQGLSTKTIASVFNLSTETIKIHRKHIRKKLELFGRSDNLQSYLKSLID